MRLIGHVNRNEPGRLAGWAADADDPARVVEITILLDGRQNEGESTRVIVLSSEDFVDLDDKSVAFSRYPLARRRR